MSSTSSGRCSGKKGQGVTTLPFFFKTEKNRCEKSVSSRVVLITSTSRYAGFLAH